MQPEDFGSAVARLNAGGELQPVDASLLENLWNAMSRIPKPQGNNVAIGIDAITGFDPNALPLNADKQVAVMMRYAVLEALQQRGVLVDYMTNDAAKKRVFEAAATFPCDKNDLSEALAESALRNAPPERQKVMMAELTKAGYDPDHLAVADKFVAWMNEHC